LKKVLDKDKENFEAMIVLGRTYEKINDEKNAKKTYKKAVDNPNCKNANAFFYLGIMHEKSREYDSGISMLK